MKILEFSNIWTPAYLDKMLLEINYNTYPDKMLAEINYNTPLCREVKAISKITWNFYMGPKQGKFSKLGAKTYQTCFFIKT